MQYDFSHTEGSAYPTFSNPSVAVQKAIQAETTTGILHYALRKEVGSNVVVPEHAAIKVFAAILRDPQRILYPILEEKPTLDEKKDFFAIRFIKTLVAKLWFPKRHP